MLERIKKFFKRSETIFWSYVQIVVGFLTGVLAAIDWTALTSRDWSQAISSKEALFLGLGIMANGIITYVLRSRNMKDA